MSEVQKLYSPIAYYLGAPRHGVDQTAQSEQVLPWGRDPKGEGEDAIFIRQFKYNTTLVFYHFRFPFRDKFFFIRGS